MSTKPKSTCIKEKKKKPTKGVINIFIPYVIKKYKEELKLNSFWITCTGKGQKNEKRK